MEMLRTETMYKTNTSGVRGVYYSTKRNKWIAQIMFKKKCYYLGGYDRLEGRGKGPGRGRREDLWKLSEMGTRRNIRIRKRRSGRIK